MVYDSTNKICKEADPTTASQYQLLTNKVYTTWLGSGTSTDGVSQCGYTLILGYTGATTQGMFELVSNSAEYVSSVLASTLLIFLTL